MTTFADTSAVVTLYADEPGSDLTRAPDHLVVSALTKVEVTAALWRKQRLGELTVVQTRTLVDAFLTDWAGGGTAGVVLVPVVASSVVLDLAVSLTGVHGLRAYDAVQLASAVAARAADPEVSTFLGFDSALNLAAAAEGFLVNDLP